MLIFSSVSQKSRGLNKMWSLESLADATDSIRSLYKLLSNYRDRDVFTTVKHFKMERFANNAWMQVATRKFSGQVVVRGGGGLWN